MDDDKYLCLKCGAEVAWDDGEVCENCLGSASHPYKCSVCGVGMEKNDKMCADCYYDIKKEEGH